MKKKLFVSMYKDKLDWCGRINIPPWLNTLSTGADEAEMQSIFLAIWQKKKVSDFLCQRKICF